MVCRTVFCPRITDPRRGGGTLGQSDWTRYANRPYAPTLSQLIAAYVLPFPLPSCVRYLRFRVMQTVHDHCERYYRDYRHVLRTANSWRACLETIPASERITRLLVWHDS